MKRNIIGLSIIAMISLQACNNSKDQDKSVNTDLINNTQTASGNEDSNTATPEFEFESDVYDFGEISQGEKVETQFKFKNIGDANLIITDAKGSCGCTVPEYPKQPIAPGEVGIINVVFDSNGKQGRQHKTITLISNTEPNTKVLALKGNIITPNK